MSLPTSAPAGSSLLTRDAVADTLAALVRIDSVNPSYGGPAGGERRVVEWAAEFLNGFGLAPRSTEAMPGRPNLRVRLEGERPGRPVLFETHVDTVSTRDMTIDPHGAQARDGRLWGRGATDAKGQAAALLHAMAAWAQSDECPPQPIELALVVDEEFSFGGAKGLLADGIDPLGIIIAEPTELRLVTSHKGTMRWWIEIAGQAAHGAKPRLGVNAISAAAALIQEIDEVYIPQLGRRRAPLLEPPTINVAQVHGGVQANLVPPSCRIELDRRFLPGETREQIFAEFEGLFEGARRRFPQFRAVQEEPVLVACAVQTDMDWPLVKAAQAVAVEHDISPEPVGVDYATDACALVERGAPIVIVGPGSIDQAHTRDEFIELSSLEAGARFFADLMGQRLET